MYLAVIVASRGLAFSQTMEELIRELEGVPHRLFFSVGRNLPECFNVPIEEALKDEFTHILICEDDMILPKGILNRMIKYRYPVVALDYPFKQNGDATTLRTPDGYALYTGTGFMLIDRLVLDFMEPPYFRTDTAWDMMITKENELVVFPRDVSNIKTYGLHDVHFGILMYVNDMPIYAPPKTAGQRKLKNLGPEHTNIGMHQIYELTEVLPNNTTKNASKEVVEQYLRRVTQITKISVLDEKPDYIYYKDGQARLRDENHVIV